jgi:diguanylate cyclase (GGDEF)-like protein/PAS domain S-box-containing protein
MPGQKKFVLPKAMPFWLEILLAASVVLGLLALVLSIWDPNRWQGLFIPAVIGSVLLVIVVYWLIHMSRMEKVLQEERNLLRTLIDTLPDNIFIKDAMGRVVIDNTAHQRTLGANALEEVVGKTDFDFFPRELAAQYDADEKQVMQSGEPLIDKEEPVIGSGQDQRWLLTTKVPWRDRRGKITGIVGFNHDITERKQADEKLAEERGLLRTMIDNLPDLIYVKDIQGRKIISNLADWQAAGGKAIEDVIGKTDFDVYPAELAARFWADDKAVIDTGVSIIDREEPARDPLGNPSWLLTTKVPLRDAQGKVIGLVGIGRDITERKQAEEARRRVEERYRGFFENSFEGIFQTTPQGRFITANPALAQMLGYDSPEELMASVTDLDEQLYVDPAHRAELRKRLDDEERVSSFESEVYRKDGSRMWVLKNVLAVRDERGDLLYYEGTLVDITARKQMEQAQQEAQRTQAAWISELERRTRQLSLLNQMSDLIQCCSTMEEAYSVIGQQAQWIFSGESGALYVLCASRNLAESVVAWGKPLRDLPTFRPADCWAFRRGQLHEMEVGSGIDPRSSSQALVCSHLQKTTPAAHICVPLIAQGETLGVLHLRHNTETKSDAGTPEAWYTEARKQLAHTVADSLALAISNLRLRESLRQQSIRDPLTGMFNRRYMEESLDREVARATRAGRPLGVMMIDIDHFKHFNDMFGHEAGDAVLRGLGAFFRSQIREADIACRYGGEEFALIMPDASLETTRQRAEKIREEVKQMQVKHHGQMLGAVTLSLGVAEIPSHGSTGEVLIRVADAALYRAKKAGRDRVMIGKPQKVRERIAND